MARSPRSSPSAALEDVASKVVVVATDAIFPPAPGERIGTG